MKKYYEHVAVIGIDGMGNFCKDTDTPNFDRIFSKGARTDYAWSMDPTISAENWGGMLLGALPAAHGLTNSIVGSREYTNAELPSVFKRIREAMGDVYLSSCVNWNPINHGIIEHDIGVTLKTADSDGKLLPKILREVKKKPTFLFVQFDEVDGRGHGAGYGTPKHLSKIRVMDRYTGKIYDAYKEAGILDKTLFIVIADHGGYSHGHGGYSDGEKFIFLGAAGKYVPKGKIDYAQTKDISAIVLTALGIEVPEFDENGYSSQVPDGIFKDIKGVHEKLVLKEYRSKSLPVIAPEKRGGLYTYACKNDIACAFLFEGNVEDITGNVTVKETGHIKFYNTGVRGECAEPGENGYAVTSPVSLDSGFTVSMWIKKDKAHHDDAAVVSVGRPGRGFTVYESIQDAKFRMWTGGNLCESHTIAFPIDLESGWTHFAAVFDNAENTLEFYINFRPVALRRPGGKFKGLKIKGPVIIGEDLEKKNNTVSRHFNTLTDGLIIFSRPLGKKEIAKLGKYWRADSE